jgi:hypothetical protein
MLSVPGPLELAFEIGDAILQSVNLLVGFLSIAHGVGAPGSLGSQLGLEIVNLRFELVDPLLQGGPTQQLV